MLSNRTIICYTSENAKKACLVAESAVLFIYCFWGIMFITLILVDTYFWNTEKDRIEEFMKEYHRICKSTQNKNENQDSGPKDE